MSELKDIAKELCEASGCHHKCNDTKDCVVEEEALLLINENKSNNFDVKSNEELFKQALVEGVNNHIDKTIEKEKQIEEMAAMIKNCKEIDCSDFIDCHLCIATQLHNAGYRKQSEGENVAIYPSSAFECSECHWGDWDLLTADSAYKYCPNCGAKMKGGEE